MNDYAVPINGVDALHAHFAAWVQFLDAKGLELEAQLAKLEAKKARAVAPDQGPSGGEPQDPNRQGYLELAFGEQALQAAPGAAAGMPAELEGDPSPETGKDADAAEALSEADAPEPVCPDAPPEDVDLT